MSGLTKTIIGFGILIIIAIFGPPIYGLIMMMIQGVSP